MKKKILFLTPRLPYPLSSGGVVKTNKMLSYLSQFYDIYLAMFLKDEDHQFEKEFLSLVDLKNSYSVELNIPRSAASFLKGLLFNLPMSVYRNRSNAMKTEVERLATDCDVIFIDHFLMFQYVPKSFKGKVLLHQHNAEYVMWERFAKTQTHFLKKWLVLFEALRIKNYERRIINRANKVLAAPNDIEQLSSLVKEPAGKFAETYHLGDEDLLNLPDKKFDQTAKTLLYIGTLSWEANIDGLLWFLKEVWPQLKLKHPDLTFEIIGKIKDENIFATFLTDPGLKWLGFVENLTPHYEKGRIFISPLRFGSGIKVKVVNALYRGIPVVTTSIGVEGLDVKNHQHLFFSDQVNEQIDAIDKLLRDEVIWTSMAKEARHLAKEKYTWSSVLRTLSEVIEE